MALHNELGKKGEELAVLYFSSNGYEVLFRNWRYARNEIDVIAFKAGCLHFVEVKTRTFSNFLQPEVQVNKKKFQRLLLAADLFLYQHQQYQLVQYDILSITIHDNKDPEVLLFEDIYLF